MPRIEGLLGKPGCFDTGLFQALLSTNGIFLRYSYFTWALATERLTPCIMRIRSGMGEKVDPIMTTTA